MDAFTPQQTIELVSRIGCKKTHMRWDKLFWNSFMAGPLLGFGCAVTLSTEAAPWYQQNAPGLIRTISAMFFPVGLIMIVLSGADLFTSNVMFMFTAFLHRRASLISLAIVWVTSFLANLAGTLFFMAIVTGYGGVFEIPAYRTEVINFATAKCLTPTWVQIFCRAIGANWLVCFAVYVSISSREIASKILAIWFPTFTFVALGLDHVIANMYFIPVAIFYGHPDIGVGLYIWKSMIPTTLGNVVGGGLFVGGMYWYLYLTGEGSDNITFSIGGLDSAMEVGGPMGPSHRRSVPNSAKEEEEKENKMANGEGPGPGHPNHVASLPSSGHTMTSGLGRELTAEKYTNRKGIASTIEGQPVEGV
ncbi:hypothetical protein HO173_009016 [Letharia columbiana]|uniref:Formate/nitrite transporter n=1 Tax=Letharia columbiana TaxID=112416 RepID=A0A8H6FQB8_9LECA|nr:uncharacterized protein HO173_009016 [Letharia columbiana]KAF6232802.1 hypothetical protein HO173_009016 [Letharia columbiana]